MKWLESITNSMDMNLSKLWEIVEDRQGVETLFPYTTLKGAHFSPTKPVNV